MGQSRKQTQQKRAGNSAGEGEDSMNVFLEGVKMPKAAGLTNDVQPVVRCKDCKYCLQTDEFEYWCDGFCSPARLVRKEDFCSHGKAKE